MIETIFVSYKLPILEQFIVFCAVKMIFRFFFATDTGGMTPAPGPQSVRLYGVCSNIQRRSANDLLIVPTNIVVYYTGWML
ncbi:MAG: hypothetical protein WAW41_11550 [Methylobacter sp.]